MPADHPDKDHGVEALSGEFKRYDQVKKPQEYRLAEGEGEGDSAFDDEFEIHTCDISGALRDDPAEAAAFSDAFGAALAEIGFAIIVGHGVDPALYEESEEKVIEAFTRPTLEEKLRFRAQRFGSVSQGYFPIKETSDIHPDLVEGWVFCRRAFHLDPQAPFRAEDYWPVAELEPHFRRLAIEHEKLFLPLMRAIARYLGCDPHIYDGKLTGTNFGLRLNYYPPIDEESDRSGAGRLLGHEDVDLFTILPAPRIEGLQVLNRKNGKWVRLNAPPGSIIINTGDYMQRISNDILPSTTHRVSKPRDRSRNDVPRVSFPMAVYVWEDEMLEVLPGIENPHYEPVKAIAFHTRSTSKFYGDDYAVE